MGITEEDEERLSFHVSIADRLALLVLEMKRAPDGGDRRSDRRTRMPGDIDDRSEDERQPAEEGADDGPGAGVGLLLGQAVSPSAEAGDKSGTDGLEEYRCAVMGPQPDRARQRDYNRGARQKERSRQNAGCDSLAHLRM